MPTSGLGPKQHPVNFIVITIIIFPSSKKNGSQRRGMQTEMQMWRNIVVRPRKLLRGLWIQATHVINGDNYCSPSEF